MGDTRYSDLNSPFADNPYAAPTADLSQDRPERRAGTTEPIHGNPWLTIWTQPRATIRGIVDTDPTRQVALLGVLGGIAGAFNNAIGRSTGDILGLTGVSVVSVFGGAIGGLIGLYIGSAFMKWAGSWIGGQATYEEVRSAMAWSGVPSIVSLLLLIPMMGLFGNELFSSFRPSIASNPGLGFVMLGFGLVMMVLGFWQFFIYLKCIGEVHRFSAWKSLLACFLLVLVIAVPLILLGVALYMGARAG